jgi:purine-binding chemotaxis protein CheW
LDAVPLIQALVGAPDRPQLAAGRPEQEFFCFRLGELQLGVPSENVREVIHVSGLTPLPRVPGFLLGVAGYRGEVLPVLDLLRFLGKGEGRIAARTRLFVGISETYICAVIADAVVGLRRIPVEEIMPPPIGNNTAAEHLLGVVHGKERWNLLNLGKLLTAARQKVVTR